MRTLSAIVASALVVSSAGPAWAQAGGAKSAGDGANPAPPPPPPPPPAAPPGAPSAEPPPKAPDTPKATDPPLPRHRFWYGASLLGGLSPTTPWLVQQNLRLGYRVGLGQSGVVKDTFIGLGFNTDITQQLVRFGPILEIRPLSFLQLTFGYDYAYYFSTREFATFKSVVDEWGEEQIDQRDESLRPNVQRVHGALQLGYKFGPVGLADRFRVTYQAYDLANGDTLFFDIETGQLTPANGFVLENDFAVSYVSTFGLEVGANLYVNHAVYDAEEQAAGIADPNPPVLLRAGPVISFVALKRRWAPIHDITFTAAVNWWILHKNNAGSPVPWVQLGAGFVGDIWGK